MIDLYILHLDSWEIKCKHYKPIILKKLASVGAFSVERIQYLKTKWQFIVY